MNIERVFLIFSRLADLEPEQAVALRFMCEAAVDQVCSYRKNSKEACGSGRAEFAAAALAYYRYVLWSLTDGEGSEIRIGDISMKQKSADCLAAAERLCREAFEDAGLLSARDVFVFEGI